MALFEVESTNAACPAPVVWLLPMAIEFAAPAVVFAPTAIAMLLVAVAELPKAIVLLLYATALLPRAIAPVPMGIPLAEGSRFAVALVPIATEFVAYAPEV